MSFFRLLLILYGFIIASSLDWGTFRPGYYFGLSSKHNESPLIGLMWYDAGNFNHIMHHLRHECNNNDKINYGYQRHNGNDFATSYFVDPITNTRIIIAWVKFKYIHSDGNTKYGWFANIEGSRYFNDKFESKNNDYYSNKISFIWYIINNETNLELNNNTIFAKKSKYAETNYIQINGKIKSDDLDYTLIGVMDPNVQSPKLVRVSKNKLKQVKQDGRIYISALNMNNENKWKTKTILQQMLQKEGMKMYSKSKDLIEKKYANNVQKQQKIFNSFSPNIKHGKIGKSKTDGSNVMLLQSYIMMPLRFYLIYLEDNNDIHFNSFNDLPTIINSQRKMNDIILAKNTEFDIRFQKTFNIKPRPSDIDSKTKYDKDGVLYITNDEYNLAQYALSNLIGGIGYWYGDQIYELESNKPSKTDPMTLYSAVPCRSFFPRGFLWDEGFHQLLISKWDINLSINIISSWLNNMDKNGWIPREQILGDESRDRVPKEFQVQKPYIANPPTLFLAIHSLYKQYSTNNDETCTADVCYIESELVHQFLNKYWDKLVLHFKWYINTQTSPYDKNSFRWRGREKDHNLPSGLDDYPRHINITDLEGHIDIHCWMIKLYRTMSDLAKFLGKNTLSIEWQNMGILLTKKLDEFHYDKNTNSYQDYIILNNQKEFVYHIGYVSCFPIFLEILDLDSPYLEVILDQITDVNGIWSPYGLRSLSKNDTLYGTKENYWRGDIWININYLALKSLKYYSDNIIDNELRYKFKDAYNKLRNNIINNLINNYVNKGFLYETYNGNDGNGQRSHPFTGWTSLILNIIAQIYN